MTTKTITLSDRRINSAAIKIGNENDNNAERIKFVLPARLAGAAAFLHLHIGDYVDIVRLDDERTYTPTRTHTQYPGKWTAYLEAMQDGDVVWHSDTFALMVGDLPIDGERIEQQYPSAIEEALKAVDTLTGTGAKAESVKPTEEASVQTIVDEDGNRILLFGIPRGVTFTPYLAHWQDSATGERWVEIRWQNDGGLPNPDPREVRAPAGVGIKSIEQTTTSTEPGGINIITVTLTNGETAQFEVRNGYGGEGGIAEVKVDGKTIVQEDGILRVNTTDKAEADNTQPITSAGVHMIIGNINAILRTI